MTAANLMLGTTVDALQLGSLVSWGMWDSECRWPGAVAPGAVRLRGWLVWGVSIGPELQ